jgi:HEAT repeats/Putative zinc-finger
MNCEWVKANIALYVYDELADDARFELEQHVARCANCALEVRGMREFHGTMSALPQVEPSPNLVASSRMRLQEALETTEQHQGWRRWVFDPTAWLRQMRFSPALAAVLLIVGFSAGILTTYRVVAAKPMGSLASGTGAVIAQPAEASITGIRGIAQQPGSNRVEIKYDTVVPQSAEGSLEDPRIQQLLMFAARNNYNSGVRMDSVDLLTQRPDDSQVREALIYALRYDSNPGVRLKALEGLGKYVKQDLRVRNAVLEALINDSNPGLRAEAITLLEPVRADSAVRNAMRKLAASDESPFVRTQCRMVLASTPEID